MRKILVVYGTRPEAIKMAPLVIALGGSRHCMPVVAVTGQHRVMLDQVNALFNIRPSHDLNIITERQRLEDVMSRVLDGVSDIVKQVRPDAMVVQGDTSTSFAAALAAFYNKVPVVHLEAGLRTGNLWNPFPEEANRRLTSQITAIHLAPTATAKRNLIHSGIPEKDVTITGNTVIDALFEVVSRKLPITNPDIKSLKGRRFVLVTAHRRESWGEPMARTARAVARLARVFTDTAFLLPAHLNPIVRDTLLPPLRNLDNVLITAPLDYSDFVHAMSECSLVLTDSGGVQEEAPSLGKPVLVLRETTERPEAVDFGTVKLVGTDVDKIVSDTTRLLTEPAAYDAMARAANPYGDGKAAWRAVAAIENFFGHATPLIEFDPARRMSMPIAVSAPRTAREPTVSPQVGS